MTGIREGALASMCPTSAVTSAGQVLSLVITALGSVARPISRAGLRRPRTSRVPADPPRRFVTGKRGNSRRSDRARFGHPIPRSVIKPCAPARQWRSIFDGLAADVAHIAAASKVRTEIDADRIPHFDDVHWLRRRAPGEYEIVVTAPDIDVRTFVEEFARAYRDRPGCCRSSRSRTRHRGERIVAPAGTTLR